MPRRTADPDDQLAELWRTIRDNVEMFRPIVARMDPADVNKIKELWRTIRTATKRRRRRKRTAEVELK
jgi:hypothetical protein